MIVGSNPTTPAKLKCHLTLLPYEDDDSWIEGAIGKLHACLAKLGERHVRGCDREECPYCGDQLLSCDCEKDTMAQ